MEKFFSPKEITAMEMDGIRPATHVNVYEAYDIMLEVRSAAKMLLPLNEPKFSSEDTIGYPSKSLTPHSPLNRRNVWY